LGALIEDFLGKILTLIVAIVCRKQLQQQKQLFVRLSRFLSNLGG
jgi:hypothetical protein